MNNFKLSIINRNKNDNWPSQGIPKNQKLGGGSQNLSFEDSAEKRGEIFSKFGEGEK